MSDYIKSRIKFDTVGFIIGKELVPATKARIVNGSENPAKPEHYDLHVVVGDLRPRGNLFGNLPIVITAVTTRDCFKNIVKQSAVNCKVEQKNGQYYKLLSVDGIQLLGLDEFNESDYEDDYEDEDIPDDIDPTATDISETKKSKAKKGVTE